MQQKRILVDDWIQGEIIEYNGFSGFVNFISNEYITVCIHEYEKPPEVAKHSRCKTHQVCLLVFNQYWDKVIRKDNK